jgi:hypothetical protein
MVEGKLTDVDLGEDQDLGDKIDFFVLGDEG